MIARRCVLAMAAMLCVAQLASGERLFQRFRCVPRRHTCVTSNLCTSYVSPCFCYKYPIATFPNSGGGSTTLYMGERHDEGCPSLGNTEGYCDEPLTAYLMGPSDIESQDCLLCQCNTRYIPIVDDSLERAIHATDNPTFVPPIDVDDVLHTDFIEFEVAQDDWVRAKVFLVELPPETARSKTRLAGIGFEVETTTDTEPSYRVRMKYVERSTRDPYLFYVDRGGMRYGVVVTSQSVPAP